MGLNIGDTIKCNNLWEMQKIIQELLKEGYIVRIKDKAAHMLEIIDIMSESEI